MVSRWRCGYGPAWSTLVAGPWTSCGRWWRNCGPPGRAYIFCCVRTTAWACRRSMTSVRAKAWTTSSVTPPTPCWSGPRRRRWRTWSCTTSFMAATSRTYSTSRNSATTRLAVGRSCAEWSPSSRCTPQGSQRRYVVTNLTEPAAVVYRQIYVQRGAVPEQPIGEMKNGLRCERLSSSGFCANAFRLLIHALAYAIVVLFREAAADVPEVATASVSTLRQRLWKVAAVVVTSPRRVFVQVSSVWPYREVWQRVQGGGDALRSPVVR